MRLYICIKQNIAEGMRIFTIYRTLRDRSSRAILENELLSIDKLSDHVLHR